MVDNYLDILLNILLI